MDSDPQWGRRYFFRSLPVAEHAEVYRRYFFTPHHINLEKVAALFSLHYERIDTLSALFSSVSAPCLVPTLLDLRISVDADRCVMESVTSHLARDLEGSNSKFRKKYRFSLEENALIE